MRRRWPRQKEADRYDTQDAIAVRSGVGGCLSGYTVAFSTDAYTEVAVNRPALPLVKLKRYNK